MTPTYWKQATQDLAACDPIMQQLIHQFENATLVSRGCSFTTLARSIVGQQISVKAAESIWQRFIMALPSVSPLSITDAEPDRLRACGLSARKIIYLKDLSQRFLDGTLNETEWTAMDDQAVIDKLVQVKGIGRWTAEMFLIFHLQRPNILPLDDIGLQRAISQHYLNSQPANKSNMLAIAQAWHPWCSVATWYLWRSLDPFPVEY